MDDIDLDKPLFKFFSERNFYDALREGYLYFHDILKWDDVWEQPLRCFSSKNQSEDELSEDVLFEFNKNKYFKIYGTCFTENYDTDAMWRIYSNDKKHRHVCVETTPRKLLDAILEYYFVIGAFLAKVAYFKEDELVTNIFVEDICWKYPHVLYPAFIKRDAFLHEKEVRLVLCEKLNKRFKNSIKADGVKLDGIDFRSMISKIILDPRLKEAEAERYMRKFEKHGLKNVEQSQLYKKPEFNMDDVRISLLSVRKWESTGKNSVNYLKLDGEDGYNYIGFINPSD